ncbi:phage integrase family protein [Rhodococcus sp. MTM3W5.2]|uniref:tyrosine-type recombinase/integrase n=1 Tax=Rhodococcus sp. MTM3W5.2 TaxID=1805827 RepID=UPI0009797321|nr:tyrosine-type recombinase/integrase [Rhodococcus sp. MTM3W5.2]AQA24338.1 phage integrase family protein [Rhodococcus sp. MTM3W5.2]
MATIEPYSTAAGKRYMVRYRTPEHGQTKKRGFRTKRDAEAFAATVEVEKLTGSYVAPALGRITVGELGADWLARKQTDVKPSSYNSLETAWRIHVAPRWGRTRIADIDLDAVERWITELVRAGKGPTVVIRAYGVLASILDGAVKARRLASNPARGVENLPRKQRKARVYLTHEQVQALAEESGQHETLVYLLAYCGLRWGEAIALRVEHLDLLRKRLTVVDNAVQVNMQIHVGTPKSHVHRSVPIPPFLVEMLARQCEGQARGDLVFPGRGGGYLLRPVSFTGWFTKAVQRADVPPLTPHDLRHTAASLAVSAGVNVKALQRMLGHASAAMTLDTYADLFDDDLEAVGSALDDARSRASVPKVCPPAPRSDRGSA